MLRGQDSQGEEEMEESRGASKEAFSISDVGCERELNEDRFDAINSASAINWVVCDGMGGVAGGEFAAQLAIDAMTRVLSETPAGMPNVDALTSAVREANRVIVLRRRNKDFASMGTTVVAARFDGSELVISSIGDSRAYLIRDGAVQQLTVDHTYVQTLVDEGKIQPEDALNHPEAHVLTQCLGAEPNVEVPSERFWLWPTESGEDGDTLLLCSDGLYSLVPEAEIGAIVSGSSPQEACEQLVQLACSRGGYDNVTMTIIPFAGILRQTPPSKVALPEAPQRRQTGPQAHGRPGLMKHLIFLTVMSGLAAAATVVGFVAMRLLK